MKNLQITFVFLLLMGCSGKQSENTSADEQAFNETDLQGKWEQIVQSEGKWVIDTPCDADNYYVRLSHDTLFVGLGQETVFYKVKIHKEGNVFVLQYEDTHFTRMEPIDTLRGLAKWWISDPYSPPSPGQSIMVHQSIRKIFTEVFEGRILKVPPRSGGGGGRPACRRAVASRPADRPGPSQRAGKRRGPIRAAGRPPATSGGDA